MDGVPQRRPQGCRRRRLRSGVALGWGTRRSACPGEPASSLLCQAAAGCLLANGFPDPVAPGNGSRRAFLQARSHQPAPLGLRTAVAPSASPVLRQSRPWTEPGRHPVPGTAPSSGRRRVLSFTPLNDRVDRVSREFERTWGRTTTTTAGTQHCQPARCHRHVRRERNAWSDKLTACLVLAT